MLLKCRAQLERPDLSQNSSSMTMLRHQYFVRQYFALNWMRNRKFKSFQIFCVNMKKEINQQLDQSLWLGPSNLDLHVWRRLARKKALALRSKCSTASSSRLKNLVKCYIPLLLWDKCSMASASLGIRFPCCLSPHSPTRMTRCIQNYLAFIAISIWQQIRKGKCFLSPLFVASCRQG